MTKPKSVVQQNAAGAHVPSSGPAAGGGVMTTAATQRLAQRMMALNRRDTEAKERQGHVDAANREMNQVQMEALQQKVQAAQNKTKRTKRPAAANQQGAGSQSGGGTTQRKKAKKNDKSAASNNAALVNAASASATSAAAFFAANAANNPPESSSSNTDANFDYNILESISNDCMSDLNQLPDLELDDIDDVLAEWVPHEGFLGQEMPGSGGPPASQFSVSTSASVSAPNMSIPSATPTHEPFFPPQDLFDVPSQQYGQTMPSGTPPVSVAGSVPPSGWNSTPESVQMTSNTNRTSPYYPQQPTQQMPMRAGVVRPSVPNPQYRSMTPATYPMYSHQHAAANPQLQHPHQQLLHTNAHSGSIHSRPMATGQPYTMPGQHMAYMYHHQQQPSGSIVNPSASSSGPPMASHYPGQTSYPMTQQQVRTHAPENSVQHQHSANSVEASSNQTPVTHAGTLPGMDTRWHQQRPQYSQTTVNQPQAPNPHLANTQQQPSPYMPTHYQQGYSSVPNNSLSNPMMRHPNLQHQSVHPSYTNTAYYAQQQQQQHTGQSVPPPPPQYNQVPQHSLMRSSYTPAASGQPMQQHHLNHGQQHQNSMMYPGYNPVRTHAPASSSMTGPTAYHPSQHHTVAMGTQSAYSMPQATNQMPVMHRGAPVKPENGTGPG